MVVDPDLAALALTAAPNPLSIRERQILSASAGGGTVADIAAGFHLSPSTVRTSSHSPSARPAPATRPRHCVTPATVAGSNSPILARRPPTFKPESSQDRPSTSRSVGSISPSDAANCLAAGRTPLTSAEHTPTRPPTLTCFKLPRRRGLAVFGPPPHAYQGWIDCGLPSPGRGRPVNVAW